MTLRRLIALSAASGLILVFAACGSGGGKSIATKTPAKKTPTVTGTVTANTTATANTTPGAATTPSPGGGGNESPTPRNTPTPRPSPVSGTHSSYRASFTVASDPNHYQALVERGRFPSRMTITIGTGAMSIDAQQPFINVAGTLDANGNFTATGTGSVSPYHDVQATFQGTIIDQQLTGTYTIGTNGALPGGGTIIYNVTGTDELRGISTPSH